MPRPDPFTEYREQLAELLTNPLIVERFAELERLTVDALIGQTDEDEQLRLVQKLKILREFKRGVSTIPQIKRLDERRKEAVANG